MAMSLMRLMPNLRGPAEKRRRLYSNVINSIILYGVPIWAEMISKNKEIKEKLRRIQRNVGLRVISAYRTTSHEAVAILASQIPLDIKTTEYARVYNTVSGLRERGHSLPPRMIMGIKNLEREASVMEWTFRLEEEADRLPWARVRDCLVPVLGKRLTRRKNLGLFFRTTQIMTGHECFNWYLFNINRAISPICAHCRQGYCRVHSVRMRQLG